MKIRFPRFPAPQVPAVWVLFLIGAGCMSVDPDQNRDFSAGIQQKDIPVPLSFEFDKDRSYSFIPYNSGEGSFRSWSGFYYGDQQVANIIPWYHKQMVVDGWTLRGETSDVKRKGLTFVKADETATIWVYREFDARIDRYQTVINAEIHPTPTEAKTPEEVLASLAPPPLAEPVSGGESAASGGRTGIKKEEPAPLQFQATPAKAGKPSPREVPGGNKPVVKEEPGDENNEDQAAAEDASPEDGE